MGLRLFRDRIGRVLTALDEGHNAAELMNIRVFLWLRFGSGGRYLLRRRLFGGQGMLRYLEAVGTGIVPERICVQSAAAVDGITGLRPNVGGHA
jgi:hypothetical protein